MQRRTLLQILSGVAASLFMGVNQTVKVQLLPAVRTVKRGISAMPFVKILDRPERRADGAYVVAKMVHNPIQSLPYNRETGKMGASTRSAANDWSLRS